MGIVGMSSTSILLLSVSLGDPAHCEAEVSNNPDSSFFSLSLKLSCMVCSRKATCLMKKKVGKKEFVYDTCN